MDAKTRKAVAGLLRQFGKALCELRAAKEMLAFLAQNKKVLVEWERALEEMKTKPGYDQPAHALEMVATALEQYSKDVDFIKLKERLQ
jgi:hypothetical protein